MCLKLLAKGVGSDILQVHVNAGNHIQSSLWLNNEIIGYRHPFAASNAALNLLADTSRQLGVPAGFESNAVFISVDANRA